MKTLLAALMSTSSGFVETGYLVIVKEEDSAGLAKNVAMQYGLGIDTMRVTAKDLEEIAPMVSVVEGEYMAWEPRSGYADTYMVTTSYAKRAREMGAEIVLRNPATEIEISGGRLGHLRRPTFRRRRSPSSRVPRRCSPWGCWLDEPKAADLVSGRTGA